MRLSFCFSVFFAVVLHAGQQAFVATPSSLAGWSLAGAELSAIAGQTELTLPAGAQFVRSVRAAQVRLQLTARPVLGENIGDWPVVELGDAALVFSRKGTTGRLLLVLGDKAPRELPVTFALDAGGHSVEALTIGLTRAGDAVSVTTSGQTLKFSVAPLSAGDPLEIIVSAGAIQPWIFEHLEVVVVTADPVAAPQAGASASAIPAFVVGNPGAGMMPTPVAGLYPSAAGTLKSGPIPSAPAAGNESSGVSTRSTLEIYTPPAVRHGRTKVIRAAIQARLQN